MIQVTYTSNSIAALKALKDSLLDTLERSADVYIYQPSQAIVPLDEGPLQDSGEVLRDDSAVYVSYGKGESASYAVDQHENLFYRHAPGRQAKFLENPFRAAIPSIISDLQSSL